MEIETVHIRIDELPLYLAVGSASGFGVEQIAKAGEEYPHYGNDGYGMIESLGIFTVKEGCVAVSITRPEGSKDRRNNAFWTELRSREQTKADQSSKATAK